MSVSAFLRHSLRQLVTALLAGVLVFSAVFIGAPSAEAITAPELRGQRAVQDISSNMHGRDLKEKEFLKADLREVDLGDADLRGHPSPARRCR